MIPDQRISSFGYAAPRTALLALFRAPAEVHQLEIVATSRSSDTLVVAVLNARLGLHWSPLLLALARSRLLLGGCVAVSIGAGIYAAVLAGCSRSGGKFEVTHTILALTRCRPGAALADLLPHSLETDTG